MRYIIVFFVWVIPISTLAQETAITGVYKGHPLYIQNPYNAANAEFCINQIKVNGQPQPINLTLTAIKLNFKGVDLFTPVSVHLIHGDSCKPRIVNPEALLYHSSFKFDSLFLNDSILHWFTKGDRREGSYIVEKLDVDFWDEMKRVRAKGRFDGAQYVYFPEHEDGGNKFRIKYELPNGRFLYSKEMEFYYFPELITFSPKEVRDEIILSRISAYEIRDASGEVILRGTGDEIPLRLLKPGDYSLVLAGQPAQGFVKK